MVIENDVDKNTDNNHIEEGSPGIKEADEAEIRYPLSGSSKRTESISKSKEEFDIAKKSYELDREQEQTGETKNLHASESKVKVGNSLSRTTFEYISKFQDQLKWQINRTKNIETKVNAIQKTLVQIDKTKYSNMKEHGVIRSIEAQLNTLQMAVDKLNVSVATFNVKRRVKTKIRSKTPAVRKKVKKSTKLRHI